MGWGSEPDIKPFGIYQSERFDGWNGSRPMFMIKRLTLMTDNIAQMHAP